MDKLRESYRSRKLLMLKRVLGGHNVIDVSRRMKVGKASLYKWHSGDQEFPDCNLSALYDATQDMRVYTMLMHKDLGAYTLPSLQGPLDMDAVELVSALLKETAEAGNSVSGSLRDKKYTRKEYHNDKKELHDAKLAMAMLEKLIDVTFEDQHQSTREPAGVF